MSDHYSVKECLRGYTNASLGMMCERWQLAASTKASRIRAVEKVLRDPLHLDRVVQRLDAPSVRLLRLIAQNGPVAASDVLAVPGLFGNGTVTGLLHDMAQLGLVLACPHEAKGAFSLANLADAQGTNGQASWFTVLDGVAARLPEPQPLGIELPPATDAAEPLLPKRNQAATAFLETLRAVESVSPRVTATGDVHRSDAARAYAIASEAHVAADAFDMALLITRELGFVKVEGGRLVPTGMVGAWLARSQAERSRDVLEGYLRSQEIPDLKLFFPEFFEALEQHLPAGSVRRTYHRVLAAQVLREQPANVWFTVDAFVEAIRRLDPNVLFLDEPWRALQSNVRDATTVWKHQRWQTHERRLFSWMIQQFMSAMGIVEITSEGHLFRVTPLGKYALGAGPPPEEEQEARQDALTVQADFEVVAYLDRCSPLLRWKLDSFCERQSSDAVRTYRITQESIYRGVRRGMSAQEFVRVLEAHSRRPLPANVRDQLATWERKADAISVRSGCHVAECVSAQDAKTLAANTPGARLIGSHFVLLPPGLTPSAFEEQHADALEETVRIRYDRVARPCLEQEEGLRLRAPWQEWNLLLMPRLMEVGHTVRAKNGDLIVTIDPDSAAGATDWKLLTAQLDALVKEPLASRYRSALRSACGDISEAESCKATLVRFGDSELCDAALELPETQAHLLGRLGLYTVMVRPGCLTKLKRALKAVGLPVSPVKELTGDGPPCEWAREWVDSQAESCRDLAEEEEQEAGVAAPLDTENITLPSYSPRIVREILEDAIERRRPVLIQYRPRWSSDSTVRRVNPVSLDLYGASPSLNGYCHQHGGARTFQLARIVGIRVLEDEKY